MPPIRAFSTCRAIPHDPVREKQAADGLHHATREPGPLVFDDLHGNVANVLLPIRRCICDGPLEVVPRFDPCVAKGEDLPLPFHEREAQHATDVRTNARASREVRRALCNRPAPESTATPPPSARSGGPWLIVLAAGATSRAVAGPCWTRRRRFCRGWGDLRGAWLPARLLGSAMRADRAVAPLRPGARRSRASS